MAAPSEADVLAFENAWKNALQSVISGMPLILRGWNTGQDAATSLGSDPFASLPASGASRGLTPTPEQRQRVYNDLYGQLDLGHHLTTLGLLNNIVAGTHQQYTPLSTMQLGGGGPPPPAQVPPPQQQSSSSVTQALASGLPQRAPRAFRAPQPSSGRISTYYRNAQMYGARPRQPYRAA